MGRTTDHKEGNATVRIIYRTAKVLKDGSHPFWIRIIKNRKAKFIATGLSLHPKYWNDKHTGYREAIRKSYPEPYREELINKLAEREKKYADAAKELFDADEVHDAKDVASKAIEGRKRSRQYKLIEYLSEQIETMDRTGKAGNKAVYKDLKNQLTDFIKREYSITDIRFDAVTVKFCNDFESYFRARGNTDTSLSVRFRTLRTLYNRAIAEGVAKPEKYPFARNVAEKHKFSVGKFDTSTKKRAISRADVRRIEEYQPEGSAKGKYSALRNQIEVDRLLRAKDVFLFSFYVGGINFVDLSQIRWKDLSLDVQGNWRLSYIRQKTGGRFVLRLLPPAVAIIEQYRPLTENGPESYIFTILDHSTHKTTTQINYRLKKILGQVNKDLKAIGEKLELQTPLTTYVARHSFATSLKQSGVATAVISQAMGHKSEAITTVYLDSFDNETVDAAFDSLL